MKNKLSNVELYEIVKSRFIDFWESLSYKKVKWDINVIVLLICKKKKLLNQKNYFYRVFFMFIDFGEDLEYWKKIYKKENVLLFVKFNYFLSKYGYNVECYSDSESSGEENG